MPEEIDIADIKVMPPHMVEPYISGERQEWVDIAITLNNSSSERTYFVISKPRTLKYDPATKTLTIGLREPEPIPGIISWRPPAMIAVQPQKTVVLHVSVPLIIHNISSFKRMKIEVEDLEISDMERIICKISYHTAPFYPKPEASTEEMGKELLVWGKTIQREFTAKISKLNSQGNKRRRK